MDNVTILNNSKNGFTFQNDSDVSLTNSSVVITNVAVTNQIGVNVDTTNNVFIDNVKVINNFDGFAFNNSTDIVIDNSIAEKNVDYGYRYFGGSKNIIFNNDIAINNTVGGFILMRQTSLLKIVVSISNGTGFFFDLNVRNVVVNLSKSSV